MSFVHHNFNMSANLPQQVAVFDQFVFIDFSYFEDNVRITVVSKKLVVFYVKMNVTMQTVCNIS